MTHTWPWPADGFDAVADTAMDAWRGVAAQQVVATLRLVDTLADQLLLEQMLEDSQPRAARPAQQRPAGRPFPRALSFAQPLPPRWRTGRLVRRRNPARRRRRGGLLALAFPGRQRGPARPGTVHRAHLLPRPRGRPGARPHVAAWLALRELWTRDRDYAPTQALAEAARGRAVHWLRYESVRAPGTPCAAVLQAATLQALDASSLQTWHCKTTRHHVMLVHGEQRHEWRFPG